MFTSTSNSSIIPAAKAAKSAPYSKTMQVETGLANLGNTCFMNSSLQLLLHIEPLVNYFRAGQHAADLNRKSPTRGEVAISFYKLIQDIEANTHQKSQGLSTASSVSPFELQKAVGNFAPYLMDYSQQDCQEFLRFLLDGLGEDLKRPEKNAPLSTVKASSSPKSVQSSASKAREAGNNRSSDGVSPSKMSLADRLRMQTLENRSDDLPRTSNNNDEEIDDPKEFITRKSLKLTGSINQGNAPLVSAADTPVAVGEVLSTLKVESRESETRVSAPASPTGAASAAPPPVLDCAAQAEKSWQEYLRRNDSIITDIFAGQLQSTVECLFCHHKSYTFDPFLDLSVPVPSAPKPSGVEKGMSMLHSTARTVSTYVSSATTRITPWRVRAQPAPVPLDPGAFPLKAPSVAEKDSDTRMGADGVAKCTLSDCLDQFTAKEILDNDSMYLCEKCNQRRKCSKTLKILRYPKVLVIHLNRFRYSSHVREKVHTDVKFPTKGFNLQPFMEMPEPSVAEATVVGSAEPAGDRGQSRRATAADPAVPASESSTGDQSSAGPEDPTTSPVDTVPLARAFSSDKSDTIDPVVGVAAESTDGSHTAAVGSAPVVYDLAGISHHSGSMSGGHYIAHIDILNGQNCAQNSSAGVDEISFRSDSSLTDGVVTNPVEKTVDKDGAGGHPSKWMCFNDARVSAISSSAIGGPTAYVLFYNLRRPSGGGAGGPTQPPVVASTSPMVSPSDAPIPSIPAVRSDDPAQ